MFSEQLIFDRKTGRINSNPLKKKNLFLVLGFKLPAQSL